MTKTSDNQNSGSGEKDDQQLWTKTIISIVEGNAGTESLQIKKIRKQVLIALQHEESDKAAKKMFKRNIKLLETSGDLILTAEGIVSLANTSRIKVKKAKKKRASEEMEQEEGNKKQRISKLDADFSSNIEDASSSSPQLHNESIAESPSISKNKPCKGNPQGVTRLFLGNLAFAVDETSLSSFLKDKVTHIKWITDKETGKFYGSAFVEMADAAAAADVVGMTGTEFLGRPLKASFAPARPGDKWPPEKRVISGGSSSMTTGGQAGGTGVKAMGTMPENCYKLFIGNLSYEIDDDAIRKFFETTGAELKSVRWLHHKDSGDFKGCGFAEFWTSEACKKAASLNGKDLLGRPIRLDWSD